MRTVNGLIKYSIEAILMFSCFCMINSCRQENAKTYFNRSIAEMDAKQFDKALIDVNMAIKLDSNLAEAYYIRGQIFELQGKAKACECEELHRAATLGYKKAIDAYNQNCVEKPKGEYNKLLVEFESYIRQHPDSYEGYYDRANLNFDYGFYDKAILDYNKALAINEYPIAYYNRGVCYLKLNQKDKGCSDVHKALLLGYQNAGVALPFCK